MRSALNWISTLIFLVFLEGGWCKNIRKSHYYGVCCFFYSLYLLFPPPFVFHILFSREIRRLLHAAFQRMKYLSSSKWSCALLKTHFVRPKSRHLSMSRTTEGWDAFVHRHGATRRSLTFHTGLWNIHTDCAGIAGQRVPLWAKRGCEQFLWIHC